MNVTVIGSGSFGFSIALMLLKNNNNVTMWTSTKEKLNKIKNDNYEIIPGIKVPKSIKFTNDIKEAVNDAQIIYIMTSVKYIERICLDIKKYVTKDTIFCLGSKGIEQNNFKFVHEIFKEAIGYKNYAIISGPSFAVDVANNEPIGFSIASSNSKTNKLITKSLKNDSIKLRTSSDMVGVELCGAIKNVIAVASGIISGLGYHESTRSFLIVEAVHDIMYLIKELNGKKKTILSYAGIGDLLLTCTSTKSRNYSYGILIGSQKFKEAEEYLKNNTVEGYYTTKSLYTLLKKKKIKMPTIDLIYNIVINNENPSLLIDYLIKK